MRKALLFLSLFIAAEANAQTPAFEKFDAALSDRDASSLQSLLVATFKSDIRAFSELVAPGTAVFYQGVNQPFTAKTLQYYVINCKYKMLVDAPSDVEVQWNCPLDFKRDRAFHFFKRGAKIVWVDSAYVPPPIIHVERP